MNEGPAGGHVMDGETEDEGVGTWAVVAHGILNSAALIEGFCDHLRRRGTGLTQRDLDEATGAMLRHAGFLAGMLKDLALGLAPDVTEALDELDRQTAAARAPSAPTAGGDRGR